MKKSFKSTAWVLPLLFLVGCQTNHVSESQRFEASVRKELPFRIDSLRWFDGVDITYQFACQDYVSTLPDTEIDTNGELTSYRTLDFQKALQQTEDKVWRNVVVSKKNQRIICIDRFLKNGRTKGYVYVLQSESKRYPSLGKYHWDVSDPHNMDYWTLMFHADSLFADGLHTEAKQIYDLAFTEDRYILPSQLSP